MNEGDLRKSAVAALSGLVAIFVSSGARAQELTGAALVHALQKGGYVIVIRHAHAPATPPAQGQADAANVAHERQLDPAGRSSVTAMGAAWKRLHIPVGRVWSSPTYRARQTVQLAELPKPQLAPELGDRGQSMQAAGADQGAWLRGKASEQPAAGTNTVIVTHLPNISAAFGDLAKDLGDGGALVFRPTRAKPPQRVGKVAIEDWPKLAGA